MHYVNEYEKAEYITEPLKKIRHTAAALAITETMGLQAYLMLVEEARGFKDVDPSNGMSFNQKLDWALHTADGSLDRIRSLSI